MTGRGARFTIPGTASLERGRTRNGVVLVATSTRHQNVTTTGAEDTRSLWCRTGAVLDTWASHDWTEGVQLEQFEDLESLAVRTENSVYELTVLSRRTGEVLVRGGRFFPEWTRASLAGSSLGGSFLKLGGIYVGFSMELHHLRRRIITSPVRAIGLLEGPATVS